MCQTSGNNIDIAKNVLLGWIPEKGLEYCVVITFSNGTFVGGFVFFSNYLAFPWSYNKLITRKFYIKIYYFKTKLLQKRDSKWWRHKETKPSKTGSTLTLNDKSTYLTSFWRLWRSLLMFCEVSFKAILRQIWQM